MNFIEELKWRGMLQDISADTESYLSAGMATAYIGFDPTAPSLTIGNYVQIMLLHLFQKHGHKPIVLMGGATGRIGDPSHKDTERPLKTYEELDRNLSFQKQQFEKFLDFSQGENRAEFRNNLDFYQKMNVLDFLRDVGKNFTVNYMMAKESVKKRVESGLSFTEFSYQLIQAYDFQILYAHDNCKLQMGGSDQWGNITSGIEMIRRNLGEKGHAITTPLLTKADGSKFGKSENGNIWLDPQLTTPYQFYQFWINADDRDLEKFIRYFSLRPHDEMEELIQMISTDPQSAKRQLAEELTVRVHSWADFESVQRVSALLFQPKMEAHLLTTLTDTDWEQIALEIPCFNVAPIVSQSDVSLEQLLTEAAPVFSSKSEYRRTVQSNALSVNKEKVSDPQIQAQASSWFYGKYLLVENGKKNKYLIISNH
jgi:tyrosyl-tRNA synthetase